METYTVKDLTFRYPESKKDVLKNISFSVESGEFVTICGLSGCGKSTLLRQLKTALQPYGERTGTILFEGQELDKADFRTQSEKIGFVMQSPDNQSITDKVWHELAFGLESLGLKNSVIQRRTAETASFFGIEKWFEKNVDELSGGQKQILNLASVMIMQPSVLILDEPTAQLDPIASENFITMLRKINLELGTTIILSEHSLDEVFGISDRIIVMSDGEIISDNQPLYTGKKLFELKSSVFCSLPAPVRVYEYVDGKEGKSPLSVSEGRKWLESWTEHKTLREIPKTGYKEASDKPILELQNLWFRYERNLSDILKGLSLKVYAGEIVTILGGNGTGKTTMLSVISGILRQNRGKILVNGREKDKNKSPSSIGISVLPQNPQTLFVKAKVEDDLYEIFSGTKVPYEEQCQKVENVIRLCGLDNLRKQHPYDLSGGEQQRAALAKVLLTEPKILLLDEPTKGLDTAFKSRFAAIIKRLARNGTAVVAVSHDIEFCAEYADKCAMMFNGRIVSTGSPKEFFTDNEIYTTSVNRMSRGTVEGAVTVSDLLYALDKENKDSDFHHYGTDMEIPSDNQIKTPEIRKNKKAKSIFHKITSLITLVIAVVAMCVTADILKIPFLPENKILWYIIMFLSAILFMLMTGNGNGKINIVKKERNMKRMLLSLVMVFIAVPITIFAGIYFFDDTKYLFISLLIMFESIFPFYIMFEKRGIQARELVLTATICAMCVSGRAVLYMIPEFKPVTALVIISAAALGSESGFLIGSVTMLVSNIFFGQGVWTPWQMFTMGLIGFVAGFVYQRGIFPQNKISLAIFGFISAFVIYGGIMNPATLVLSGTGMNTQTLVSSYIVGLPVDTVHAVSTAMFLYIGAEPIISKLERIKRKYGLIQMEN